MQPPWLPSPCAYILFPYLDCWHLVARYHDLRDVCQIAETQIVDLLHGNLSLVILPCELSLDTLTLELEPRIASHSSAPTLIVILNESFSLAEPQLPHAQ